MLKLDTKRAFGPWLWLSVALFFALCVSDTLFDIMDTDSNVMMTFLSAGNMIPIYMLSAIVACLPFATVYLRDRRCGLEVSAELRCGRRKYLRSKLLCSALSGGLTLALGLIVYIVFLNLRLSHDYSGLAEGIRDTTFYDLSKNFSVPSLIQFYGVYVIAEFFAGMFYAVFGLMLSAFIPNIAITLCSIIVSYRFIIELSRWVPPQTIPGYYQMCSVDMGMLPTLGWGVAYFSVLTLICAAVFLCRAGRQQRGGAA